MDLVVCALLSLVLLEWRSIVLWFASSGGLVGYWLVWLEGLVVSKGFGCFRKFGCCLRIELEVGLLPPVE